jgi:hypothetical protein
MLPLQYLQYAQFGKFKTGLPGSRREPHFIGMEGYISSGSQSQLTLDPQLFQNDDNRSFFISHVIFPVGTTGGAPNIRYRVKPTDGEPWSRDFVGSAVLVPLNIVSGAVQGGAAYVLPEPYPLAPGASLEITIANAQAASLPNVGAGIVGYYESLPAYTKARKRPYTLYSSTLFSGDTSVTKAGLPLLTSSNGQFSRADLNPGFPFVADYIAIGAYAVGFALVDLFKLFARVNISGRPRMLETRVPYSALLDRPDVGGAIPLYGTRLNPGDEFIVDIENQTGSNIAFAECAVVGYRAD